MTDAIRDALREALGDLPTNLQRLCAERTAAFLRALPACDVMMDRPEGAMHSTRTLAAAVERAAKDGA